MEPVSIIYDALKKTQNKREFTQVQATFLERKLNRNIAWLKLGLLGAGCLLLFTIFSYYPRVHLTETPRQTAMLDKKNPPVKQLAAGKNKNHVMRQALSAKPILILNGVFLSENERVAMINQQYLHKGDMINGMQLLKITANKVILRNADQELVALTML